MSMDDALLAPPAPPRVAVTAEAFARSGLIRLAEGAVRAHGPVATLALPTGREVTLLTKAAHGAVWARDPSLFTKDPDSPGSGMAMTRAALGPTLLTARQGAEWRTMRDEMTRLLSRSKPWFRRPLAAATDALADAIVAEDAPPLLDLCRAWAERALCDPLLGTARLDAVASDLVGTLNADFLARLEGGAGAPPPDIAAPLARIAREHGPDSVAARIAPEGEGALRRVVCGLLAASLHINALSLFWTLVQVARQPDVIARLRTEADACPEGPARVADAPLAFACIREAQRLRPAMAFIERQTVRALEFDGYRLPAGATVLFSPWFAGRDPDAWDAPARFDPDRFAPGRRQVPGAYIPFGAGPRVCPGANLVNQQLTFALSRLAARLDLAPEATERPGDLIPIFRINLEPRGQARLTARRRAA